MKWLGKLVKFGLVLGIAGALAAAVAVGAAYYYLEPSLPDIDNLRDVRLQVPLKVLSHEGGLIADFCEQRRTSLDYDEIPPRLVQAFLAAEDDSFFEHPGVDYRGLLRAGLQLALTGEKKQGGSTITMQVARNFYLSSQKTYTRKLSEIFLALRIEDDLTKQEILELYLNKIYLGQRAYGIAAAAKNLTVGEGRTLVLLRDQRFRRGLVLLGLLVGAVLALMGAAVLVSLAGVGGGATRVVSFGVYGLTLFLLYLFSTLYHRLRGPAKKGCRRSL